MDSPLSRIHYRADHCRGHFNRYSWIGRHSLSHYVIGVRVARYDSHSGSAVIVDITDGDELRAARCSLGCLGVILSVKIQCRPKYLVEEHFREYVKLDDVLSAEQEYPLQQFYWFLGDGPLLRNIAENL